MAMKCDKCGQLDERTGRANYFGKGVKLTVIWHGDLCKPCKTKKLLSLLNQHSEIEWKFDDFIEE